MNNFRNQHSNRPAPPRAPRRATGPSTNDPATNDPATRDPSTRDPAALDPAIKRRLLGFAALLGTLVFLLGTAGFAFFFGLDDEPPTSAPLEANTNADTNAGMEINGIPTQVPVAQGGEMVQAVMGLDASALNFNPLFATGEGAQTVVDLLFPRLLGQDPMTGLPTPTELAEHWEVSEDGRTYTFTLRETVIWSDGTPVNAEDFLYTYRALAHPENQSPFQSRAELIESIQAPNAHTLVVTLHAPNCAALHSLRHPLLPHAHFAPDFSDLSTHALNQNPQISAGPFLFEAHTPGDSVVLARNPDYWKGVTHLERYILRHVDDAATQARLLAAGEIDLARLPPAGLPTDVHTEFQAVATEGPVRLVTQPQPGYTFLAANLADPAQPVAGRTAEGERQPQPPHPILGDLDVRRALAFAIDEEALLVQVWGGGEAGAYRLGGYLLPTLAWANPAPPAPADYDPEQARNLLDAAGWTDDATGIRSRDGQPLALRLVTNADNPQRVAMAQAIAEDLSHIGVQIHLEALSFEAMTAELLEQRFDLSVAGWDNLVADPGLQPFWHSRDDRPGQGFNLTSFQDPEVDAWLDQALTLPGCAPDARGELYAQVQARVQSQLPYLTLVGTTGGWAVSERVQNLAPGAWQLHYNVQNWGFAR